MHFYLSASGQTLLVAVPEVEKHPDWIEILPSKGLEWVCDQAETAGRLQLAEVLDP